VDDNPADRSLAAREVRRVRSDSLVIEVDTFAALRQAVRQPFDVVVVDFSLGWSTGIEVLQEVRRVDPDVGAVLFTGSLGEELAVEALKSGFDDYVLKDPSRLARLRSAVAVLSERVKERREARRLRERHEQLFQLVPVGLFVCQPSGDFQMGNPRLLQMLGVAGLEELRSLNFFDLFRWEGPRDWARLEAAGLMGVEAVLEHSGGAARTVLLQSHRIPGDDTYQGAVTDVTPLRRAVQQKEALVHEVLHRVYNNLQSVQGLLRVQGKQFEDPRVRDGFEDVSARVLAMAMVQRNLHTGGDLQRVNFANYLADLVEASRRLVPGPQVRIELEAESVHVDIERALPLGLIANELLTNALEHAFPSGRAGLVIIEFRRAGQDVLLIVQDDGVGTAGLAPSGGVGTVLLSRLVRQVEGQIFYGEGRSGLRAEVRAPL
jgi:two-component sensor histidine kinase